MKKRKRLLLIHPQYRYYRRDFFHYLSSVFYVKFVFVKRENPGEPIPDNLKAISLGFPGFALKDYNASRLIKLVTTIARELCTNPYDAIITSTQNPIHTYVAFVLSLIFKVKVFIIVEQWFSDSKNGFRYKFARGFKRFMMKHSILLAHGERAESYCKRELGVGGSVFRFPHCSNDLERMDFRRCRRKVTNVLSFAFADPLKVKILFLGRLLPVKGVDILIRAFALVESELGDRAKLVICGEGPIRRECEKLANDQGIQNITFTGQVDPTCAGYYMSLSDIFVYPSIRRGGMVEGWGLAINEAASLGKPIITTNDVGCVPELVRDGYNGFVVSSGDPNSLYKAMKRLILDHELRQRMGRNSRKLFEDYQDLEKARDTIMALV